MNEAKYVIFKLGKERYGLPIEYVERILPNQSVTRIPRSPKMMLGVFELRGETLPAMDARERFGMPAAQESKNMIVIVCETGRCAIRVDSVDGIESFGADELDAKDATLDSVAEEFLTGIGRKGNELTVLLDAQAVIPGVVQKKMAAA